MENIKVGDIVPYEVVWFDGPNGTGNVVPDPGASSFVSDNPAVLSVQSSGTQTAAVDGVAVGSANLQATSSTGIVAGSLDATGAFVTGPLAFTVAAAAAAIVSGIVRAVATARAAVRR